ncbi:MAG: hypothetical protein GKS06_07135 [Acidobacteria bacterium]|nr:hypothetical protein [Acidobacteriota bacterium]
MSHRIVSTDNAPSAIGPYSQAVVLPAGREVVFVAGQIPVVPETGEVLDGPLENQVHQVMRNLTAVLDAAGSDLERVVKTSIFLRTMDDFAAVNEVYAGYFGATPPARATVAVVGLPKDVRVEIEAIAYI